MAQFLTIGPPMCQPATFQEHHLEGHPAYHGHGNRYLPAAIMDWRWQRCARNHLHAILWQTKEKQMSVTLPVLR
jgi:hypothetical protein